jgi:dTDP-4-dehydrorhamnose reductase
LLEKPPDYPATVAGDAVILAGITSIVHCERDPEGTSRVNVDGVLTHCAALLDRGWRIIYLSTSAVFSGAHRWPEESAPPDPRVEYGRQRAEVEGALTSLTSNCVEIWRLTKFAERGSAPWDGWIRGSKKEAFDDVLVSPLSRPAFIRQIRHRGDEAIHHFSPLFEATYFDVAQAVAKLADARHSNHLRAQGADIVPWASASPGLGTSQLQIRLAADATLDDFVRSLLSSEVTRG